MVRLTLLAVAISALVSCERSNRTIEVQPTNPNIKPDNSTDGGNSKTKTGSLSLSVSGLPSTSSYATLSILINGEKESRSVSLSGGSGTTSIDGLDAGYTTIKVSTTISGTYYSGSTSASIISNDDATASVSMSANQEPAPIPGPTPTPIPGPTPTPIPGPTPTPIPGPTPTPIPGPGPGGDTSIDIGIDIGGVPGPSPNPSNVWDGKTFKGNSMFNVEPVN